MSLNKMTREACVARYGHIDFSSAYWHDQSKWIKSLIVPDGWFPSWHYMDTAHPVKAIGCNIDLHAPLMATFKSIHDEGFGHLFENFAGAFNIRMVRGSNSHFSAHSYGLALDINTHSNGLGNTSGGFYKHPEFVQCWKDQGFTWGGDFNGRKDPMHFTWAGF